MNHEYRERADFPGRCAACGLLFARCMGSKPFDLSFLSNRPEFSPSPEGQAMFTPSPAVADALRERAAAYRDAYGPAPIVANSWEAWCRQFSVDPNTPDESLLDDFLHGRAPNTDWAKSVNVGDDQAPYPFVQISTFHGPGGVGFRRERRSRLGWRTDAQREFYAGWDAYDAAYAQMPKVTRDLQDRMERVELERLWAL